MVSGMNLAAYWISNYVFDILKAEITMGITIGLMYAFGNNVMNIIFLKLIYSMRMSGHHF